MIFVLDFGSQYSHLIVRRIRELGVTTELVPHNHPLSKLKKADGLILSGGPQNLSESTALRLDRRVFDLKVPVLGICYGLQLLAFELGGRVKRGKKREYGPAIIKVEKMGKLFQGLSKRQMTWMSHGDKVVSLPRGFKALASSKNCRFAAIADEKRKIYGIQFHPEVAHTPNGTTILKNFIKITGAKKDWNFNDFIKTPVNSIKAQIGTAGAICALSGGVDSTIAAALANKAIGDKLTCVYVDNGLMRLNETGRVERIFKKLKLNYKTVNAEKEFLAALKGVSEPEKKRKIIGRLFIRIFEREARKIRGVKYLIQGTLYTDAIESSQSIGGKAAEVIKTHHNVGGLPKKMGLRLVEPLRELYKDEVRRAGKMLKLPKSVTERQPFPGPGLAIRIVGSVTREKLDILRQADAIVREEIKKSRIRPEQYFAVLPDIKTVGVQGDSRTYGYPIILRAVTTKDFMTADWTRLPHKLLAKLSTRITNEVAEINRVVYDITSKPPGTVEWE